MSLELTYQDVAEHNTKKDIYLVIHDKIYNASKFIDEHPGGEEVMLDVGGQDATEAFEDVGHSDEARETLDKLFVGTLKRQPGDAKPNVNVTKSTSAGSNADQTGLGIGAYATVLIGALVAYGYYQYMMNKHQQV